VKKQEKWSYIFHAVVLRGDNEVCNHKLLQLLHSVAEGYLIKL
jgi:hypothetical protein